MCKYDMFQRVHFQREKCQQVTFISALLNDAFFYY